jgi:hypothetical protein
VLAESKAFGEAYDDFMRYKRDKELNNFEHPIMD